VKNTTNEMEKSGLVSRMAFGRREPGGLVPARIEENQVLTFSLSTPDGEGKHDPLVCGLDLPGEVPLCPGCRESHDQRRAVQSLICNEIARIARAFEAAEKLVRRADLMVIIVEDIGKLGVAGERDLIATLYLIGTSRKLARPLAGRVKGPRSSGKSFIIEHVARMMPPESVLFATEMTPKALFHMAPNSLRNKFIVAGERSRKDDNEVAEATRALREMISAGRLSKLMPIKFGQDLQTVLIEQEGPVAYVESTTLNSVFAEDENRRISLFTDERDVQTRRVMTTLATKFAGGEIDIGHASDRTMLLSQAVQRMLARKEVTVPFAPKLAEHLPDNQVEVRRAFPQIISLVQAYALLYQHQRQHDSAGRIIAARQDYQLAHRLLCEPMRRLLGGGISQPARRFHERQRKWFLASVRSSAARMRE
jgi:hypothetical protein